MKIYTWHKYSFIQIIDENTLAVILDEKEFIFNRKGIGSVAVLLEQNGYLSDEILANDLTSSQQETIQFLENTGVLVEGEGCDSVLSGCEKQGSNKADIEGVMQPLAKVLGSLFDDVHIEFQFNSKSLEDKNKQALNSGQSWLLTRIVGSFLYLGPYFTNSPNNTSVDSACWECLLHRIRWNSPVRAWLHKSQGIEAEIAHYRQPLSQAHIDLIEKLAKRLKASNSQFFYAIRLEESGATGNGISYTEHPVFYRPQCACCGDANHFSAQQLGSIQLSDASVPSVDGGLRVCLPKKTVQNVLPFVDTKSGVINFISSARDDQEKDFIFRCVFHKAPYFSSRSFLHQQDESKQYQFCSNETNDQFTGSVSNADLVQVTVGKGMSSDQCRASALGESIERLSAKFDGDEFCVNARSDQLDKRCYLPTELTPFSSAQHMKFKDRPYSAQHQLYAVGEYNKNLSIHWSPLYSLNRCEHVYLPTNYCFDFTPFFKEDCSRYYQNGCAAGNTLAEAILQGLLEIIERDAIAIWWYNRVIRDEVDLQHFPDLQLKMDRDLQGNWDYWVLDISSDFEIPTYVAVGKKKSSGQYCMGFGCHVFGDIALKRAATELIQTIDVRESNSAPFDFDDIHQESYLHPSRKPSSSVLVTRSKKVSIVDSINGLVRKAGEKGLEVLVLNTTRADFPLNSVKVVVPGMCHMFPFFAAERLYKVPYEMGHLQYPNSEESLNPIELLI